MRTRRIKPLKAARRAKILSDETLALYANLKSIKLAGMDHINESLGGRKMEYWRGSWKLNRLLGLHDNIPTFSPVEVDTPDPPDYMDHNTCARDQWLAAWRARCQLENEMASAL